jgi:hypothetical protein
LRRGATQTDEELATSGDTVEEPLPAVSPKAVGPQYS